MSDQIIDGMQTTALAPWFGSGRMVAEAVAAELAGCTWVGVPCMGGAGDLRLVKARSLMLNDLHRHMVNMARVASDPVLGPQLYRTLRRLPFHPDALREAQSRCKARDAAPVMAYLKSEAHIVAGVGEPDLDWAVDYFVCCWMGRNGSAGTKGEFNVKISQRWDGYGGDSATRFRSATWSLVGWRHIFRRATFSTLDIMDFLDAVKKRETGILRGKHPKHAGQLGLYVDAPWPDAGDGYAHPFSEDQQRQLAVKLLWLDRAKVVVRYGDHPLIRELYPESQWRWRLLKGRNSANGDVAECLIVRLRDCAAKAAA